MQKIKITKLKGNELKIELQNQIKKIKDNSMYNLHISEVEMVGTWNKEQAKEITEMKKAIQENSKEIKEMKKAIQENTDGIKANAEAIERNSKAIQRNAEAIERNAKAIQRNAEGIERNAKDIKEIKSDVKLILLKLDKIEKSVTPNI